MIAVTIFIALLVLVARASLTWIDSLHGPPVFGRKPAPPGRFPSAHIER